jgi:hypothetical protein
MEIIQSISCLLALIYLLYALNRRRKEQNGN